MERILSLIDSASMFEKNGMNERAIQYWERLIKVVNDFNTHEALFVGSYLIKLAQQKIKELDQ